MDTGYILLVVFISALITFLLRALPFVIFHGERRMPESVLKLGKVLPATIMAVLIIYCVKDIFGDMVGIGIPKILAILVVAGSYKWKHNTFLSIAAGTVMYMVLLHIF